jgi:SSS family solute:Na+ symporter
VFKEQVAIHFLHLYAILFVIEIAMMLALGAWRPRTRLWSYSTSNRVDMQPWRFATPCAVTLFSCVLGLYLSFSPLGLVEGGSPLYVPLLLILLAINCALWWRGVSAQRSLKPLEP